MDQQAESTQAFLDLILQTASRGLDAVSTAIPDGAGSRGVKIAVRDDGYEWWLLSHGRSFALYMGSVAPSEEHNPRDALECGLDHSAVLHVLCDTFTRAIRDRKIMMRPDFDVIQQITYELNTLATRPMSPNYPED